MHLKPVHVWWIGVFLFLPSCLLWGWFGVMSIWKFKQFGTPDWYGLTHVYLPMLAAIVGLSVPMICLRRFGKLSAKPTFSAFAVFVAVMLAWGVLDVRNEHYQVNGHDYPNGVLVDGHRHYWHLYFTWYFLPYRAIQGYRFN